MRPASGEGGGHLANLSHFRPALWVPGDAFLVQSFDLHWAHILLAVITNTRSATRRSYNKAEDRLDEHKSYHPPPPLLEGLCKAESIRNLFSRCLAVVV